MSGYFIVRCEYFNDLEYKNYAKLAAKAVSEFGGIFLVTGKGSQNQKELGSLPKTVVVKFESYQKALKCYESKTYQKALAFITSSSNRDFIIVDGLN